MPEMDEAVLKRVLPHSIEAEQSVIGSMLMDKEAITIASEQLHGEDFYGNSTAFSLTRWWSSTMRENQ